MLEMPCIRAGHVHDIDQDRVRSAGKTKDGAAEIDLADVVVDRQEDRAVAVLAGRPLERQVFRKQRQRPFGNRVGAAAPFIAGDLVLKRLLLLGEPLDGDGRRVPHLPAVDLGGHRIGRSGPHFAGFLQVGAQRVVRFGQLVVGDAEVGPGLALDVVGIDPDHLEVPDVERQHRAGASQVDQRPVQRVTEAELEVDVRVGVR